MCRFVVMETAGVNDDDEVKVEASLVLERVRKEGTYTCPVECVDGGTVAFLLCLPLVDCKKLPRFLGENSTYGAKEKTM